MANFGSSKAIILLIFWVISLLSLILVIIPDSRTAGIIVLAADVMLLTLITWLMVADVLGKSSFN